VRGLKNERVVLPVRASHLLKADDAAFPRSARADRGYDAAMKILKVLVGALIAVLVLLGGAVGWLAVREPAMRPASAERVDRTPERLARGKYLAENVAGCMECHSEHRDDLYTWPSKPETYGQGGLPFDERLGIPGVVCAQNITPDPQTGLGNWSDGEIIRAIREGVAKDGRALFAAGSLGVLD